MWQDMRMGRKPTGRVRQQLAISLHPDTIKLLQTWSDDSGEPVSRIIERLVLDERVRKANQVPPSEQNVENPA